jgi:hypothetical protein
MHADSQDFKYKELAAKPEVTCPPSLSLSRGGRERKAFDNLRK